MFVARKIARAKWDKRPEFADGEIPAVALTVGLRTKQHALSFWRCGGETADLENVALAIAAAADRIDKVGLVWLAAEKLMEDRQTFEGSPGDTPVADLADHHEDLRRLDVVRLVRLANRVMEALGEGHYHRVSRARVRSLGMEPLEQSAASETARSSTVPEVVPRGIGSGVRALCDQFRET